MNRIPSWVSAAASVFTRARLYEGQNDLNYLNGLNVLNEL